MRIRRDKTNCIGCKKIQDESNSRMITCLYHGEEHIVLYNKCSDCENREKTKFKNRSRDAKARPRIKLLKIMGGKCVCCGHGDWWNLDISLKIKITPRTIMGDKLIRMLLKNPEQIKDYQVLCGGCNMSKKNKDKCNIDHSPEYHNSVKIPLILKETKSFWD